MWRQLGEYSRARNGETVRFFDYAVIGLGSTGSQILRHLASTGQGSVVGFEQFTPAYTRTAVGGDTRLFRYALPEGLPYEPIVSEALKQWRLLNEETGRDIYKETGCLYIGNPHEPYMRAVKDSAEVGGPAVDHLDLTEASCQYPQHVFADDEVVFRDPRGGVLRTDAAVQSAVALAVRAGAQVMKNSRVQTFTQTLSGSFNITTSEATYAVGDVVVAGGSWSGRLLSEALRASTHPRRTTLTWFGVTDPKYFRPESFPVFKRVGNGVDIYGAPTIDGATIKVALAEASVVASPDRVRQELYAGEVERVTSAVRKCLNFVAPDVVRADAFPDLYTDDQQPLIGRDPGTGAYIVTGFSGKGFKLSAGVGKLVAEVLMGASGSALGFADPARIVESSAS